MTPEEMAERAELQARHSEHDARGLCGECQDEWPCPTVRLLDALAELRSKLENYGKHHTWCSADATTFMAPRCDCGFHAALHGDA